MPSWGGEISQRHMDLVYNTAGNTLVTPYNCKMNLCIPLGKKRSTLEMYLGVVK